MRFIPILSLILLAVPCCTRQQGGKSDIETIKIMEEEFNLVWSEYSGLREDYNGHLEELHGLDRANADSLFAYCEVDMMGYPEDITTLSSSERLELHRQAVEIVICCAFDFERLFKSHMARFHEPLDYRWEKFYSEVPSGLAYEETLAAVKQNYEGLAGFVRGLRTFYDEHLAAHHQ